MSEAGEGWLRPPISDITEPFWRGAREGELRLQRCSETGRLIFPPRDLSPYAGHRAPEWTSVAGEGQIWSFVVPHPPLLPPYTDLAPYNVILVALDADPRVRLVGNLVSEAGAPINSVDPAEIEIGAAVRVVFDRLDDEIHLPRWVLR